ncbi:hypothetical protein T484DRAFT_1773947 [Baffinella frigidus]|nr:hypothetical protein T484DRAFT_1773947 [Cryptophyta sp. CCMP2293]
MELEGIVRSVRDFGAFIDVGVVGKSLMYPGMELEGIVRSMREFGAFINFG